MTTALPLDLGGRAVEIAVRRSPRARRMALRVDPAQGGVVLVLPGRASLEDGRRFAERHRVWVAERMALMPPAVAFVPGARVPVLGQELEIRHAPAARRGVWIEDGALWVSGQAEHVARRVSDFLKAEARRHILALVAAMAPLTGRTVARVTVRDTRSRWGSCSSRSDLAFSWRLVLAPDWVLAYVVAHELAHLVEMNHSPAFWALTERLYGRDPGPARRWLKAKGAALHRYGG